MGRLNERHQTTLESLWNKVDILKRPQPPKLVQELLKILLDSKLIDLETNIFLFDSLPLFELKNNERPSHFGQSALIPLIVQAGLADYIFSIPDEVPEKYKNIVESIKNAFFIGPHDFDIKIEGLNKLHWEVILEWLKDNSKENKFNEQKNEWNFVFPSIWDQAVPVVFPIVNKLNKLGNKYNENKIPAIKARLIENIDGHHDSQVDPENQLFVICLDLGFCSDSEKIDSDFSTIATIHISNIPKNDTRLQESPNSTLAKIQPKVLIDNNKEITIEYPEDVDQFLLDKLDLILDPQNPVESLIATISFFRKISIYSEFLSNYQTYIIAKNRGLGEKLTMLINSPLLLFYEKLNIFLESLEEKIKITSKYDIVRFCSDLAVISILLGPIEFVNLIVRTGLINYLDQNFSKALLKINNSNNHDECFGSSLYYCRTGLEQVKNDKEIQVVFNETTSLSNHMLTHMTALKWDGITHTIRYIETKECDIPYLSYPMLSFITMFCKPFFEESTQS